MSAIRIDQLRGSPRPDDVLDDIDYRVGPLLLEEVASTGDAVECKIRQRPLQQDQLWCSNVTIMFDPPDHQSDRAGDLLEMRSQLFGLRRRRHREICL